MGWRLPPCGVVLAIASFKLLQFCDRGIVSGSPIEFSAFVSQTMGGARESTLFGALSSVYTVGTVAGCLTAPALLLNGWPQHRLLGYSMLTWLLGVGCSSIAFWLPSVPSTCRPRSIRTLAARSGPLSQASPPETPQISSSASHACSPALAAVSSPSRGRRTSKRSRDRASARWR